jgi:hypothetical protein
MGCTDMGKLTWEERLQRERDISALVSTDDVPHDVARMLITRFGGLGMAHIQVQKMRSEVPEFRPSTYRSVHSVIPRVQEALDELSGYGLSTGTVISFVLAHREDREELRTALQNLTGAIDYLGERHVGSEEAVQLYNRFGNEVYAATFLPFLALEQIRAEVFLKNDSTHMDPAVMFETPDEGRNKVEYTCPMTEQTCNPCACPSKEIPFTCLEGYKPLENLVGISRVREFETVGNDGATTHLRTAYEKC